MPTPLSGEELAACCGARRWQELVGGCPPAENLAALLDASERAFDALECRDWLEAFAAHSAIGAPAPGDAAGAREQAGVDDADAAVRTALAAGNDAYRRRFGFVFLIRARGRSAAEMLSALRERTERAPEVEFATACAEQRRITALRLTELAES